VTDEDDVWARWLESELAVWRPAAGTSFSMQPLEHPWPSDFFATDGRTLQFPAKQFVKDLGAIISVKEQMTRRQWASLLEAVGAQGTSMSAMAINDYAVEIPLEDATLNKALLAYKVDGEYLPVRKKGPLWIVYDFDSDAKLRSEIFYTRSIWQLSSLTIT
jgi:hypothetical protein